MNQQRIGEVIGEIAIAQSDQRDQLAALSDIYPAMDTPSMGDFWAAFTYDQMQVASSDLPQGLSKGLKNRLLQRIQQEQEVLDLVRSRWSDLRWKPHPVQGLMMSVIKVDRARREMSGLVRAEVTVDYPLHRHATGEEILMLEGEMIDQGITYRAGDYLYSPAGSCHESKAIAGCLFFVKTSLDDEFL